MTVALLMVLLVLQTASGAQATQAPEPTGEPAEEGTGGALAQEELRTQMARLLAEAQAKEETEPYLGNWFVVYVVVMTTAAFLGILLLVIILSVKLSRISRQLNEISDSATSFIRVGLDHFKERTGRRSD